MLITNSKGLYTIHVDTASKLVYEVPVGLWTKEDYAQYHKEFEEVIGPMLNKEPWVMLSDLRKYKVSDLGQVMEKHIEWLTNNNVMYIALIVENAIVKMQVNRALGGKIVQEAFLNEKEAEAWLKSKGF